MLLAVLLVFILAGGIWAAVALSQGPDKPGPSGTEPNPGSSTEATTPIQGLKLSSPETAQTDTREETVRFAGSCDPRESLTINGQKVDVSKDGSFSAELPLEPGDNTFVLSYRGEELTYSVLRRYATQFYWPSGDLTYGSEATIYFKVAARTGSQVLVNFNGESLELDVSRDQLGSGAEPGYSLYTGKYVLPSMAEDRDLGKITYTVRCDGVTETLTSGTVTGKKAAAQLDSDPSSTPADNKYLDVGSGLIVEVVGRNAETLDGRTTDDKSSPLRGYLPQGTVDYCSSTPVYNTAENKTYWVWRCGYRTVEAKLNTPATQKVPVVMVYNGTLPDHNEVGFGSITQEGHHTVLALDVMWKAPFFFDMAPQAYTNPSVRDWTIKEFTVDHLDITLCYATKFTGSVEIPADNPLFSSAEVIQNESDCTLRLHLRQAGGFYGWDSYYNEAGQLCFRFLNPVGAKEANNAYGADLTGLTVMLDVGHGGVDVGTVGRLNGGQYMESDCNLSLAMALRTELESIGATVLMNRDTDAEVTVEERQAYLKYISPDLCVAVHHNASAGSAAARGFETFYFGPMSYRAANEIYLATKDSGIYTSSTLYWHVYHLARISNCPVVLTENGYMSNEKDMADILDDSVIQEKARLLAQGIANYFLSLSQEPVG